MYVVSHQMINVSLIFPYYTKNLGRDKSRSRESNPDMVGHNHLDYHLTIFVKRQIFILHRLDRQLLEILKSLNRYLIFHKIGSI